MTERQTNFDTRYIDEDLLAKFFARIETPEAREPEVSPSHSAPVSAFDDAVESPEFRESYEAILRKARGLR